MKTVLYIGWPFRLVPQHEITEASSATVIVPRLGPNKNTDVTTNVSDTENVAGTEGSVMVETR